MSLRTLLFRCYHNGKLLVRYIKPGKIEYLTTNVTHPQARLSAPPASGHPIQTYFTNARKLFVNSLLNRVTNSLASDLRKRTVNQLLYKDNSKPFLAFVGVSLASGTGLLTKDDEFEGVCWEIRHAVNNMFDKLVLVETLPDVNEVSLKDIKIGKFIAKGTNAVVYDATFRDVEYALKMMFNYSAESNSHAILRAMNKELMPLRKPLQLNQDMAMNSIEYLPPHPNIVVMHFAFTDFVPSIPDSSLIYPSALPARLNPTGGFGRNMSLFILMRKYNSDLRQYLRDHGEQLSMHERILLLTQLLEGVTHLNTNRTAHRDLKSDNILLDCSEENNCPQLVITDFGSSYTNKSGLSMQYSSPDIELGGNLALMAPEVVSATPGLFSFINYSKSDVWTVGTIAYEIFGESNPFYSKLRNTNYTVEQLPSLSDVPYIIQRLLVKLLENDPSDRPSAELAATVCQLFLWAPKHWLYGASPSQNEIMQWLLTLTTKVLCTGVSYGGHIRRTYVEYQLISTFLKRAQFGLISQALQYMQRELIPKTIF